MRRFLLKNYHSLLFGFSVFVVPMNIQAQNHLVVNVGGSMIASGNLVLRNTDLDADGNFDASAGTVIFSGGGNNSINGGLPIFGTLKVNKTGTGDVTMNTDVDVVTTVNFQNGNILLNGLMLTLEDPAFLQSESETSRITGDAGGAVITTVTGVNSPTGLDIGNLGAEVTSSANLGNLTIYRSHVATGSSGQSIQRIYEISPQNNSGLNATLRFHYFDAELNGLDENTLTLWKSPDNINWSQVGYDTRNTVSNYVEKSGIADFSLWTLSDASNPLPLSLVSFSAICKNDHVLVEWRTDKETGLDHFGIEKSSDGTSWEHLQDIKAKGVNGASYQWNDPAPLPKAWYKLSMTDISGNSSYSPVFSGGCEDIGKPFMVFPNPAQKAATASISVRQAEEGVIQLYNAAGARIFSAPWELQAGVNEFDLPVAALSAGRYDVRLVLKGRTLEAGLIKQ